MTATERERLKQLADAAGLTKLTDSQLVEFAIGVRSMAELVKRLPKDLGGADEMSLVFRLSPRNGGKS